MKVKLFTDTDLDGLGTAIVAKLAFGDQVDVFHCSYRNLNQRVDYFYNIKTIQMMCNYLLPI